METYQVVWGLYALLVGWSVFYMPSLRLPKGVFYIALKAQELILLSALIVAFPAALVLGHPESHWIGFGMVIHPIEAGFTLLLIAGVVYFARQKQQATIQDIFEGNNTLLKRILLLGDRYPVPPIDTDHKNMALACMYKVLGHGRFALYESDPLPYPDAKPSAGNAFAMGGPQQNGVVVWAPELARKIRDSEFMGIITHEAAHIKNRDSVRRLTRDFFATFAILATLFQTLLAGISLFALLGVLVVVTIAKYAMGRKNEALADFEATHHGQGRALGQALAHFSFERGQDIDHVFLLQLLSSHPPIPWRTEMLETYERS